MAAATRLAAEALSPADKWLMQRQRKAALVKDESVAMPRAANSLLHRSTIWKSSCAGACSSSGALPFSSTASASLHRSSCTSAVAAAATQCSGSGSVDGLERWQAGVGGGSNVGGGVLQRETYSTPIPTIYTKC